MLFLAVFCGFMAEYQLEHKIEHDREKQFILSLVEDLSQDIIHLNETADNLRQNVTRMDTLKHLLSSDDVKDHGAELYYLGRRASRGAWVSLHDPANRERVLEQLS